MFFFSRKKSAKSKLIAENQTNCVNEKILTHVGIIMDGNGRWATLKGKPRAFGHSEGSKVVDKIVRYAFSRGVKVVTLYTFSSENWSRPKEEIDKLFSLLYQYLEKKEKDFLENGIRFFVSGELENLPEKLSKKIKDVINSTKDCDKGTLNLAFNYGGRQEIITAVNKAISLGEEITVDNVSHHLYTSEFPDPELIIRTSGEQRLSNFLIWQSAYSEFYFTKTLWPDFDELEFDKAIADFNNRKRRFGGIDEK